MWRGLNSGALVRVASCGLCESCRAGLRTSWVKGAWAAGGNDGGGGQHGDDILSNRTDAFSLDALELPMAKQPSMTGNETSLVFPVR